MGLSHQLMNMDGSSSSVVLGCFGGKGEERVFGGVGRRQRRRQRRRLRRRRDATRASRLLPRARRIWGGRGTRQRRRASKLKEAPSGAPSPLSERPRGASIGPPKRAHKAGGGKTNAPPPAMPRFCCRLAASRGTADERVAVPPSCLRAERPTTRNIVFFFGGEGKRSLSLCPALALSLSLSCWVFDAFNRSLQGAFVSQDGCAARLLRRERE